jgi:hypothetical protein
VHVLAEMADQLALDDENVDAAASLVLCSVKRS